MSLDFTVDMAGTALAFAVDMAGTPLHFTVDMAGTPLAFTSDFDTFVYETTSGRALGLLLALTKA